MIIDVGGAEREEGRPSGPEEELRQTEEEDREGISRTSFDARVPLRVLQAVAVVPDALRQI